MIDTSQRHSVAYLVKLRKKKKSIVISYFYHVANVVLTTFDGKMFLV